MSLAETNRKIQSKSGNQIHRLYFAEAVAAALRQEFGSVADAMREASRLTGVNERTARNWVEAKNGPNGEFLIALCRHSDEVMKMVLNLAGRKAEARNVQIERAIALLNEASDVLRASKNDET